MPPHPHQSCSIECPHAYGERIASLETQGKNTENMLRETLKELREMNTNLSNRLAEIEKREARYLGGAGALMFVGTALGALLSMLFTTLWKGHP